MKDICKWRQFFVDVLLWTGDSSLANRLKSDWPTNITDIQAGLIIIDLYYHWKFE